MSEFSERKTNNNEPSNEQPAGPHICGAGCGCEMVQPLDWKEVQEGTTWEIDLWCPNCEWTDTVTSGVEAMGVFDRILDEGDVEIIALGEQLERKHQITSQVGRTIVAIAAGNFQAAYFIGQESGEQLKSAWFIDD